MTTPLDQDNLTPQTVRPAVGQQVSAALRWLHAGQSVILYGSTGVGKTHIAQATSRASEGSSLEHPSCHYARMPMFAPAFGVVIVRPGARATGVHVGVPWLSVLGGRMTRMTTTDLLAIAGAASGVVGALAGVGSLSWQIQTHRQSGRRVTVKASYLLPVYGPPHAPEFHDDDQIAIGVINRGGAEVTVINYGVAIGPRGSQNNLFVLDRASWATQLPAQVRPGGEPAQLLVPVDDLRRAHAARGVPFKRMRPWVELGDGRRVYSQNAVPLK